MKKSIWMLTVLAGLVLGGGGAHAETSVEEMMKDRPIGSDDAPITIIEYASMTCPHCAGFNNNALPVVKKELIETGKARYIFRDFPFDKYAIKAAMLSRCAPPEKYHDVVDAIYKKQAEWTKEKNPLDGLNKIGKEVAGMDDGAFGVCMGNADLEDAIILGMKTAQTEMKVERTPSFFFKKSDEWLDKYPEFMDILNKHNKSAHDHDHEH